MIWLVNYVAMLLVVCQLHQITLVKVLLNWPLALTERDDCHRLILFRIPNFAYSFFSQYIVEKHAKTLLPQYLGVYRITVDNKETYLLVMKSVFSTKFKIHKKYDLKGSTVDRQASSKEKVWYYCTLRLTNCFEIHVLHLSHKFFWGHTQPLVIIYPWKNLLQ